MDYFSVQNVRQTRNLLFDTFRRFRGVVENPGTPETGENVTVKPRPSKIS